MSRSYTRKYSSIKKKNHQSGHQCHNASTAQFQIFETIQHLNTIINHIIYQNSHIVDGTYHLQ
jgi:hypothetical protein